jgi:hypothetical protein
VTLRFIQDRLSYTSTNFLIGRSSSKQRFQIRFFVIEQTGPKLSFRSESEPVALITKMVANWAYKSNRSLSFVGGLQVKHSSWSLSVLFLERG